MIFQNSSNNHIQISKITTMIINIKYHLNLKNDGIHQVDPDETTTNSSTTSLKDDRYYSSSNITILSSSNHQKYSHYANLTRRAESLSTIRIQLFGKDLHQELPHAVGFPKPRHPHFHHKNLPPRSKDSDRVGCRRKQI